MVGYADDIQPVFIARPKNIVLQLIKIVTQLLCLCGINLFSMHDNGVYLLLVCYILAINIVSIKPVDFGNVIMRGNVEITEWVG